MKDKQPREFAKIVPERKPVWYVKAFKREYRHLRQRLYHMTFDAAMHDFPQDQVSDILGEFMTGLNTISVNIRTYDPDRSLYKDAKKDPNRKKLT